eukprot:TRINITY_DN2800_c0_g1_i1.p2 TRINITY_DN2800_c0_g1~~TRINITY_DN2800_c0_g1_i1.p2  ORF type:complete len:118 (-),score=42.80 TRINITY_DN2800_c0_g1_i1:35-388(-)
MSEPVLKFRNYKPKDAVIAQSAVEREELPSLALEQKLKSAPISVPPLGAEGQLVNVTPKTANADLKRMIASQSQYLARQTQIAIAEMIKEKAEQEAGDSGEEEEEEEGEQSMEDDGQ